MIEKLPGDELVARMYVETLVKAGKAQELMEAYSTHMQSCRYVQGELHHFAYEVDTGISDEIVNFARNILDEWSK